MDKANSKKSLTHQSVPSSHSHSPRSITFHTLLMIGVSFAVGAVVIILIMKLSNQTPETFSTAGLVSFIFEIALSAASILLAVEAISLSKSSEQATVERSDESIRLQNEIFMKTTEALRRIESSTGVTEKRIEDIISGRVGAISDRIVERLLDDRTVRRRDRTSLQRDVQESMLEELSPSRKLADERQREKRREARNRYDQFHDSVLLGLANYSGVKAIRIDNGSFSATGDALVDGIYEFNGRRIAVSTFSLEDEIGHNNPDFQQYLMAMAKEIALKRFSEVLLVFNRDPDPESPIATSLQEYGQLVQDGISTRVHTFAGEPEQVLSEIGAKFELE